MSEPADMAAEAVPPDRDTSVEEISRAFGLAPSAARRLIAAGHRSVDDVRQLSPDALSEIGLARADVDRIRTVQAAHQVDPPASAEPTARPAVSGDKIVERWLDSVRRTERPKRRFVSVPAKDSRDVLKRWVEGDDRAMEAWIQSSEATRPAPAAPRPALATEPAVGPGEGPAPPTAAPSAPAVAGGLPAQLVEREQTVVRWLTDLLDRVKAEGFDPQTLLQEAQDLQRQLFEERARRKQREDEIEHVKRGSIAVIKYIRSREAKVREQAIQEKDAELAEMKLKLLEGRGAGGEDPGTDARALATSQARDLEARLRSEFQERESQLIEREAELRRRTVQLEAEIRSLRSESESARQRERLLTQDAETLPATLDERLQASEGREKELLRRENELRTKFEEIRLSAEEVERRRAPLAFKEKELAAWEQQLKMTKQALELEARRVEQIRAQTQEGTAPMAAEQAKQLDDLRTELTRKEEDLRAREAFLHQRMEELEGLQRKAAEWEADQMHAEAVAVATETRARSGVRRLDDLLFGGFPPGSQILVNGPAHTGKDVLARMFVGEGLKQGIPAIWIVTDKTFTQIREEMTALLPSYPQFEEKGLVRYIDLYSRSLGVTQAEGNVKLLATTDKNALDQLVQAVNAFATDMKGTAPGYRLVFESVSTLTAYLDTTTTFRFLQPFVGRRKLEGGTAYYVLETGMHSDADLQTLEHMVDGSINLKIEQLKTFLSVHGLTDAQSRAWIGYTFTKKSFSLGSFSLDHIR